MPQGKPRIAMKSLPVLSDPTMDQGWQEEQQNRLLGFEILGQALRGEQNTIPLTAIREKMVLNQLATDYIYRKRFLPLLLKELGAENFSEAMTVIRRLRDGVH